VVFDEQIFLLQKHGGISRYFTELIATFAENPELGVEPVLPFQAARSEHLISKQIGPKLQRVGSNLGALVLLFRAAIEKRGRNFPADLVHLTFYTPGFFGRFKGIPKVSSLFDMTPEMTSKRFGFWNPHLQKRKFLTQSDAIISISNSSTEDMVAIYGKQGSTPTAYLGVSSSFRPNIEKRPLQEKPYLLFVGARSGYKNWMMSALAFAEVAKDHPSLQYILIGGGPLSRSERRVLKEAGILNRVIQKSVPDSDLPNYYSNAEALIYPSRYEGFGLPLVEAMASAIPVLASDTRINREICDTCAWYFPDDHLESLVYLMKEVLQGKLPNQEANVNLGLQKAKKFTWYSCAENTAQVYRSIVRDQGANSK
jgi:glycosyltransferase involved in cell wall biosynthesis